MHEINRTALVLINTVNQLRSESQEAHKIHNSQVQQVETDVVLGEEFYFLVKENR